MPKKQIKWLNPELLNQSNNLTHAYDNLFGSWTQAQSIMKLVKHAAKIDPKTIDSKSRQDIAQVIMICLMMFDRQGLTAEQINAEITQALDYANCVFVERQKRATGRFNND